MGGASPGGGGCLGGRAEQCLGKHDEVRIEEGKDWRGQEDMRLGWFRNWVQERSPSFHHDRGVSWVFSSCGASVGCLMKYHGDLREPLVSRLWVLEGMQAPQDPSVRRLSPAGHLRPVTG